MAYPIAAFVTGYLAERRFDKRYITSVVAMLAGLLVVYAFGVTWLALFARTVSESAAIGFSAAFITGVYPFVLPDLIKIAAAAGIVPSVWRLIGQR
jgi:biotin transporter BioY